MTEPVCTEKKTMGLLELGQAVLNTNWQVEVLTEIINPGDSQQRCAPLTDMIKAISRILVESVTVSVRVILSIPGPEVLELRRTTLCPDIGTESWGLARAAADEGGPAPKTE